MKPNIVTAIANRDAGALARMSQMPARGKVINPEAEQLVDTLFRQLKQVFPAAAQTNLKSPDDERYAKQQWIAAFAENGIRTKEQLSAGMRWARASKTPFWPSPGQFIEGCRENDSIAVGLPDADELYDLFHKYCGMRGWGKMKWPSNACYWMVTKIHSEMQRKNLTDSEVKKLCQKELQKMAVRIKSGEEIPAPAQMIEKKYTPASDEAMLKNLWWVKRQLGCALTFEEYKRQQDEAAWRRATGKAK
ncbi:TPA: DNA replication protein [Morganella morganii]|nr:DNA replication protein [Morganella morganii]HCR3760393.1 DNA replication protein [Morganella morganii]